MQNSLTDIIGQSSLRVIRESKKGEINMFDIDNSFTEYPEILSVRQLRDILQISKPTCYGLLLSNQIESIKIGREYRIPKQNVIKYLNSVITQAQV